MKVCRRTDFRNYLSYIPKCPFTSSNWGLYVSNNGFFLYAGFSKSQASSWVRVDSSASINTGEIFGNSNCKDANGNIIGEKCRYTLQVNAGVVSCWVDGYVSPLGWVNNQRPQNCIFCYIP